MALFFVTGLSGAGKSQVTHALKERGYEAYDTDDDALARWQNKHTGYIHPKSSVKPAQRTPEFLAEHDWNVPREYVEELAKKAHDKPVFLCGVASNEPTLRDLFTHTFALHIDEATLINRLQTRTNNDWGKQPHELQQTLKLQRNAEQKYRKLGYSIIDATRPLDDVVTEIIKGVKNIS